MEQWEAPDRLGLGAALVRVRYVRSALAPRYVTSTQRTLIESLRFGLEHTARANGFCSRAKLVPELYLSLFPSFCYEDTINRRDD